MKEPRTAGRGAGEGGDPADSEEWADGAEGPAREVRASGVVRRASVGGDRSADRSVAGPLRADVPCASIHEVVDAHLPYVWGILMKAGVGAEAERIQQDVFLAMSERMHEARTTGDYRAMLTRITWNKINDYLRDLTSQRERASEVDLELLPGSRRNPEELVAGAELTQIAISILAQMPEEEAMLLRRFHLEEESQAEGAADLGRQASSLRRQVCAARTRFRDLARRFYPKTPGEER